MKALHVGCGGEPFPPWLDGFTETRLDIDPTHSPDVCASMLEMGDVGLFDAVVSQHSLEHLYPHQVPVALKEFRRVLNPGGRVFIVVPDLEDVRPTEDVLYISTSGLSVCGLDMIYGKSSLLAENPYMAHHCGFTSQTLESALKAAGFANVQVRRVDVCNLLAVAL